MTRNQEIDRELRMIRAGLRQDVVSLQREIRRLRDLAARRIEKLQDEKAALAAERKAQARKPKFTAKPRGKAFDALFMEAWQENGRRDSAAQGWKDRARQRAREIAADLKAKMKASHPDHGGTNEAFREAFAAWKRAEHIANSF